MTKIFKRFTALFLALTICIGLTPLEAMAAGAGLGGPGMIESGQGTAGHTEISGGAKNGVIADMSNQTKARIEYIDVGSGDWHSIVASKNTNAAWNNVTDLTGGPLFLSLSMTGGSGQAEFDRVKALFDNDPDAFLDILQSQMGVSKEEVYAKIEAGLYPTLVLEPMVKGRAESLPNPMPSGTRAIYDVIKHMYGVDGRDMSGNVGTILNTLAAANPSVTAGWYSYALADPNSPNFGFSPMLGYYYNGSSWVKSTVNLINSKVAEDGGREGNLYFSLRDAPPPVPGPPPVVRVPEEPTGLYWRSEPQGRGEIKNANYTVDRTSETWEAMAGIPHDESLYYDAGASGWSGYIEVNDAQSHTVKAFPTVTPSKTHASYCSDGACNYCGSHSYDEDDDHDGCSTNSSSWPTAKVTHTIPTISTYYSLKEYQILEPTILKENVPYIPQSVIDQVVSGEAIVEYTVIPNDSRFTNNWSWSGVSSSYPCTQYSTYQSNVNTVATRFNGRVIADFKVDRLRVTDRESNTYILMYEGDIEFRQDSFSTSGVTVSPRTTAKQSDTGATKVTSGGTWPYSGGDQAFIPLQWNNMMPLEQDWDEKDFITISGYNGDYASSKRRDDDTKQEHLFYVDGLSFIPFIENGKKETGLGEITFAPFIDSVYAGSNKAIPTSPTEYTKGAGKVNDVVVHSPVAISEFYITPKDEVKDMRIPSQRGDTALFLTPGLNFFLHMENDWTGSVQTTTKGRGDLTPLNGKGYDHGMDTRRWIDCQYVNYPYEVISLSDGKRYSAGDWIPLPMGNKWEFTLPVSELEADDARYTGLVVAKNSPQKGDPAAANAEPADRQDNRVRYSLRAKHGAFEENTIDIVGRIGNFAIDYTNDPNWNVTFSKPVTPASWLIKDLVPKVNEKDWNKYIGPHTDIYDRIYYQDEMNPVETLPAGLDHFDALPNMHPQTLAAILPAGPGKNTEAKGTANILGYEPIKMGYTVNWSIQTIGNYGTSRGRVKVRPEFYLWDYTDDTEIPVDIYAKQGSSYKRIYDATNRTESSFMVDYNLKLTSDTRRILTMEQDLTKLVVGNAGYDNLMDPQYTRHIGSPNVVQLDNNVRTFIGNRSFEGTNVVPNETNNSALYSHAKQAQRWHGSIYLPSSSKFAVPGTKTFIDTENKLVFIRLVFETDSGEVWDVTTKDALVTGPDNLYKPWVAVIPDPDTVEPLYKTGLHPDTVIVLDPNINSTDDIRVHGTH